MSPWPALGFRVRRRERDASTIALQVHRVRLPLLALALALAIGGCGTAEPASRAPAPAQLAKLLRGSPSSLAALHAQADRLLGGGRAAFTARLAGLRGYPVVVNVWASWCGPCRSEFPLFQSASARLGRRVAFLGVDVLDQASAARSFLKQLPVSYPSYSDSDAAIARSLNAGAGVPVTAFFDRSGHQTYLHQGAYPDRRTLVQDIKRYAQG